MEIKLLSENYNSDELYKDFKNDTINLNADYVSDQSVYIPDAPDFPIYFAKHHKSIKDFRDAIEILQSDYIHTDRDIHLNKNFWHSLLTLYKRDFIVNNYPEVLESQKYFENIVLKKFDWENYIYKCVLAAEYIYDYPFENSEDEIAFIDIIFNNLDVYNYLIKYSIFRNADFVINFLSAVEESGLSDDLKKKIKDRPDLGKDERYGRRVVFELNKNYPIVMAPFLGKAELKDEIFEALALYK